ncbi:hypothetical protein AB0I77_44165 [Streptomyces sp. NPDC050619]|uniref:hypothetical protein n=1 Tax=Streptomyces sp. NPDC050619 TaxID=3157214 RepID=UPI003430EDED
MSEERTRPDDPVMATFHDWLVHVVACRGACRLAGISCHHSLRLGARHREAKRAVRLTRQSTPPR